ncbi:MAG TPA: hypothetical protein VEW91_04655 [bacterium]|nr:hypothetical protein [bacterium]
MRKATALLLGALLPLLGLAGVGQAQSSVQIQGSIQAVDCEARTIVLSSAGGSNTVAAADYTPVLVNSASVPFCTLQQYFGAPATAWLVASNSQFVAVRIDITGQPAGAYPPPAPVVVAPAPLPIAGIVLGTIIVAGLVYLLARDYDGHYYRYPYYGPYYRHYYRPEYRPYLGPYPVLGPVIVAPAPIAGVVLGTIIIAGLAYRVARDHDGRYYRYPYYGPYHRYYYRPEYRPYQGPYRDAPVREGDSHWDVQSRQSSPVPHGVPASHSPTWNVPAPQNDPHRDAPASHDPVHVPAPQAPQGGPQWSPPAHPDKGGPGYRDSGGRAPVPVSAPQRGPQPPRTAPAYHQGDGHPPAYPSGHREAAPRYHGGGAQCGGRGSDQGCSGGNHASDR